MDWENKELAGRLSADNLPGDRGDSRINILKPILMGRGLNNLCWSSLRCVLGGIDADGIVGLLSGPLSRGGTVT